MSAVRARWLWPVSIVVSALVLAVAIFASALYDAAGDSHDTTFYACLYAGSLSQVGTTPPVNCGRGEPISWSSTDVEGLPGEPASMFWAFVDADGNIGRHSGAVSVTNIQPGYRWVVFERDISACTYAATATWEGEIVFEPVMIGASVVANNPDTVGVVMYDSEGELNGANGFHVQVFCTDAPASDPT